MTSARVTFAAGIDVGNSTTEVVLARLHPGGIDVLGTARAPTRRAKGSPQSLDGAVALVRRLEREHQVRITRAVVARLRPVETLTSSLPEPLAQTGRLHILAPASPTPGGTPGTAFGRPLPIGAELLAGSDPGAGLNAATTSGPIVGVVGKGVGFRAALPELRRLAEAGVLVGVVMEDDEAVLVGNRLGGKVPVVDEIDAGTALRAEMLAVEVARPGSVLRTLTDPLRLASALGLAEHERADAARVALRLQDRSNAVLALSPANQVHSTDPAHSINPLDSVDSPSGTPDAQSSRSEEPFGWVEFESGRAPFGPAHKLIVAGAVGLARAYALPGGEDRPVDDLWTVDLSAVADAVLARSAGTGSRAVGMAALREEAPLTDPSAPLAERLGVPVLVGSESRAGWAGGISTPGSGSSTVGGGADSGGPTDCVVLDLGGGTIDAVSSSHAVVAAGGGELLTASVAALAGTTSAAAEWVKRGPAQRVEAPQLLLGEDGGRGFLDRPAPAETIGALVVQGPAGLLAFNRSLAPGEWRTLRLRLKVEAIGGNVRRALRTLDADPRTVIVLGGPAGDEEVLSALARAMPDGIAIGRGNVAGTLGHRYGVAYGLLCLLARSPLDLE